MSRAAIFIGVNQTGGLPKLADAAAGAKRLADVWARKQPMDSVQVLTDEKKPVTVAMIKKAVNKVVDPGNLTQLVIYFSGHGVNLFCHEFWQLSGAREDPQESINVAGSEDLARYCGVSHVVFISDACRTAAQGITAQSVSGSQMFRPIDPNRPRNPVDQFYSCKLGAPSNEILDAETTTKEYRAAYTGELVPALTGQVPALIDWVTENGTKLGFVRPWPLHDHLEKAMARRLADPSIKSRIIQVPDADIASRPTAWVSRIKTTLRETIPPPPPPPPIAGRPVPGNGGGRGPARADISRPQYPADIIVAREVTKAVSGGYVAGLPLSVSGDAVEIARPFGPTHQESRCGFKVRGALVVEAFSMHGRVEMSHVPADVVRVWDVPSPGTDVLLVLDDKSCAILPAVPEFLAALTFRAGSLVDVAYEPSEFTSRWQDYQQKAPELRALRGVIATATANGQFRLYGDDAVALARRMQIVKGVDPSLAIYAAYAYSDRHRFDLLGEMRSFLQDYLGGIFFDIAMLDHRLDRTSPGQRSNVLAPFPLLAQGWAYLSAREIRLPGKFRAKRPSLQPSVWTKFAPESADHLKSIFNARSYE